MIYKDSFAIRTHVIGKKLLKCKLKTKRKLSDNNFYYYVQARPSRVSPKVLLSLIVLIFM
jgi:hypothetical protein